MLLGDAGYLFFRMIIPRIMLAISDPYRETRKQFRDQALVKEVMVSDNRKHSRVIV